MYSAFYSMLTGDTINYLQPSVFDQNQADDGCEGGYFDGNCLDDMSIAEIRARNFQLVPIDTKYDTKPFAIECARQWF